MYQNTNNKYENTGNLEEIESYSSFLAKYVKVLLD